MRILFANNYNYLRGGAERVMFNEIKALEGRGESVFCFSRKNKLNIKTEYDDFFAPPLNFSEVRGFKKIEAAINAIYSIEVRKSFSQFLEHINPTIIHGHNIYGGLSSSIIDAAKKNKIPFVLTLHDYKIICPSYLMLNHGKTCQDCLSGHYIYCLKNRCHKNNLLSSSVYMAESYFNKWTRKYENVNAFICPSKFLMKLIEKAGFQREKLFYLRNPIDIANVDPVYKPGDYALFVGRLSHEKGVITLIKAAGKSKVPLKIVGGGPEEEKCRVTVEQMELSNVSLEGYLSGNKLEAAYKNAAFIVIPSEYYENAPMSIIEAYAYGKPVLGSKIGGIPEMIMEGVTGGLFVSGEVEDLADKMSKMMVCKNRIEEMGRNAREVAKKEYSISTHIEKLMEIYGKLA